MTHFTVHRLWHVHFIRLFFDALFLHLSVYFSFNKISAKKIKIREKRTKNRSLINSFKKLDKTFNDFLLIPSLSFQLLRFILWNVNFFRNKCANLMALGVRKRTTSKKKRLERCEAFNRYINSSAHYFMKGAPIQMCHNSINTNIILTNFDAACFLKQDACTLGESIDGKSSHANYVLLELNRSLFSCFFRLSFSDSHKKSLTPSQFHVPSAVIVNCFCWWWALILSLTLNTLTIPFRSMFTFCCCSFQNDDEPVVLMVAVIFKWLMFSTSSLFLFSSFIKSKFVQQKNLTTKKKITLPKKNVSPG